MARGIKTFDSTGIITSPENFALTNFFPMATTPLAELKAPHNLEAERALLGSVILDNEALNHVVGIVGRNDFFSEANRVTFGKMVELSEKSHTINVVTLIDELQKEELLEKIGGASYLASLTDGVPIGNYSAVNEYSRIVKEKSILRQLINAANNTIARCFEGVEDPDTLLDLAQSEIFEIAGEKVQSGFLDVKGIVEASFENIDKLFDRGLRAQGIATGFVEARLPDLGTSARGIDHHCRAPFAGQNCAGAEHCILCCDREQESGRRVLAGNEQRVAPCAAALLRGAHQQSQAPYRFHQQRGLGKNEAGDGATGGGAAPHR